MEQRPAPEVTIEGGPGWQVGDGLPVAAPPDPARGTWVRGAALGLVAVVALVGLAQGSRDDAGVLSLEVAADPLTGGGAQVATIDGRLAVRTAVALRNTGPRPITLQRAELLGTAYRSQDPVDRELAEGATSVVVLVRPVTCDGPAQPPAGSALRVHATTGSGARSVELPASTVAVQPTDDQLRLACGSSDPGMAVAVTEQPPVVDGGRAVLTARLSSTATASMLVTDVRPRDGLRLVRLTDDAGAPLVLPLGLPRGAAARPPGAADDRPPLSVVAVLEVAECSRLQAGIDLRQPLLTAQVSYLDGRSGTTSWGSDPSVVDGLRRASCPETVGSLDDVPPALSEAELRRAHPWLVPD